MISPGPDQILEKSGVAKNFGMAALRYDDVAQLQYTVANELLDRLEVIKITPERILEMGSGTGRIAKKLGKKYRPQQIIQLDIAINMLVYARSKSSRLFSRHAYLCADAEQLPVAENSIDMVFSNLVLQWCNDLTGVFNQIANALRPNGLFIFSTFGPQTLVELRESWATVDEAAHINSFVDMHDIGDMLLTAGLENPVMEMEYYTLTYKDSYALMQELKMLGAQNQNAGRRRSLTGKTRFRKMLEAYEQYRREGILPATFEVVFGHAWCPLNKGNRPGAVTEAVFPLSRLKQTPGNRSR